MDVESKLESLLSNARASLAELNTHDRSVQGLVDRVAALRYAEGTLVGFIDALAITDPQKAQATAPKVEAFVSEAIAAKILMD